MLTYCILEAVYMLKFLTDNQTAIELVLKIITLAFTAVVSVWTISSGLKTFRNAGRNTKNKQISDWLQLFSAADDIKRLSALHGLSENCSEIYCELFLLCGRERDWFLKNRIETELLKKAGKSIDAIIEYNKICFRYYMTKTSDGGTGSLDRSSLKKYENIIRNKITEYRISNEIMRKLSREERGYNVSDEYLDEYVHLSCKIIAKYVKKTHRLKIECVALCGASLYGAKIRRADIATSLVADCVMRHARLRNIHMKDSAFISNNMIDSRAKRFKCTDSSWNGVQLMSSQLSRIRLEKTNVEDCRFNSAVIIYPVFSDSYFKGSQFSGARVKGARISECTYLECLFKGAQLTGGSAQNAKFFRCEFNGAVFRKCSLEGVKMGGSALNGATFRECTFTDVDFAGAVLKNTNFIQCTFKDVNFEKSKKLDERRLKKCSGLEKCRGLGTAQGTAEVTAAV